MSLSKYQVNDHRRHIKAKRAIRALAAFGLIISILLIAFESVSLVFGLSDHKTVIPVHPGCQLTYCYTGTGLWSGFLGMVASIFGLASLRQCKTSKIRLSVYFTLCSFCSLGNTVALLFGWACVTNLFECLRYHQESETIDRALKIMAIMYSCLLLEIFVHSK
jgi:hypothetical protein